MQDLPLDTLDLMARDEFEQVIALHDRRSGLRGYLALHDTCAGPAFGGIRRRAYRREREALIDCLRLSKAMSYKCALSGLSAGGAKIVLLHQGVEDWQAAYEFLGQFVERMAGRLYTGPDVGTGERELGWMGSRTRFVTKPGSDGPGLLAEATARGVFAGIEAALEQVYGAIDWAERRIVVQGLGSVGGCLAQALMQAGASVVGTDIDEDLVRRRVQELGIESCEPAQATYLECDVLAPCALGAVVDDDSLERLRCGILAGAANNVLSTSSDGDALHERGILYVPDIVLNCGALVRGAVFHLEGKREPLDAIGARIRAGVVNVLEQAREHGEPPNRVAMRIAEERIRSWRANSDQVGTSSPHI